MSKIKVCLFDCGGVIYPYSLVPFYTLLEKMGGLKKTHSLKWKELMNGQINFSLFCKDVCQKINVPCEKKIEKDILDSLKKGVGSFFRETLISIEFLKQHNVKVGLLSNAIPCLDDSLQDIDFDDGCIFPSYRLGCLKPSTDIFKKVQTLLNVDLSEILFVDDKKENIIVSQKLGMQCILFSSQTILKNIKERVRD